MEIIHAIILGIVEGITEFLPISSTGHLILTSYLLKLENTEFLKSFEIAIQLGAILSVIVLYWKKLLVEKEVVLKILAAFFPTAILGFLLYRVIKKCLMSEYQIILWTLFIGGVILIIFEWFYKEEKAKCKSLSDISYTQAIGIGIAQAVAMVPGTSRSAATIIGGMLLGIDRKTIVEFSFLLAVPTMCAATALDLFKNYESFSMDQMHLLLVGFIVSFLVAMAAIKFFINYVKNHNFIPFGIYRILAALFFWLFILKG